MEATNHQPALQESFNNAANDMHEQGIPSVSFDRAIAHMAASVDVDFEAIQNFYSDLPFANKPPLSSVHIHFSAAKVLQGLTDTVLEGEHNRLGTKLLSRHDRNLTPELGITTSPTIRIFSGFAILSLINIAKEGGFAPSSASRPVSKSLSETLAHELTHFAKTDSAEVADIRNNITRYRTKQLLYKLLRGYAQNKRDVGVGAGTTILAEAVNSGWPKALLVGIGTTALSYAAHRKERKKYHAERDFAAYLEEDDEVEAREHEEISAPLCSVVVMPNRQLPKELTLEDITKNRDNKLDTSLANDKHKKLALTPRGNNFKTVEKAATKSLRKAIGVRSKVQRSKLKKLFKK